MEITCARKLCAFAFTFALFILLVARQSKWNELFTSNSSFGFSAFFSLCVRSILDWDHPLPKPEPKFEIKPLTLSCWWYYDVCYQCNIFSLLHSTPAYICWPFSRHCLSGAHISFSFVCYFSWRWNGAQLSTIHNFTWFISIASTFIANEWKEYRMTANINHKLNNNHTIQAIHGILCDVLQIEIIASIDAILNGKFDSAFLSIFMFHVSRGIALPQMPFHPTSNAQQNESSRIRIDVSFTFIWCVNWIEMNFD